MRRNSRKLNSVGYAAFLAASGCLVGSALGAQDGVPVRDPASAKRPFAVGEKLTYSIKVGPFGSGTAVAEIVRSDTIRGTPVLHTVFRVNGGLLFFKVNDIYESWFDPRSLVSLRYHQDIDQGSYERNRTYEIFPEKQTYIETGKAEQASVAAPLDDGSFLYFMRTMSLEVGRTYSFDRYFKPDRNPVKVTVARRERIRVPAGEFDAIVVQPSIKAKGIFAEGSRAEVWFADDSSRTMLQMKTRLPFGSVTFQLKARDSGKQRLAER
jgi:hypothetical protein